MLPMYSSVIIRRRKFKKPTPEQIAYIQKTGPTIPYYDLDRFDYGMAKKYNLSVTTIRNIRTGKTYLNKK